MHTDFTSLNLVEPLLTPEQKLYWARRAVSGMRALQGLLGKFSGTTLIVGNGQSLHDLPNSWLNQHFSFGVNYCHHRAGFYPPFYVVGDVSVAEHEWIQAASHHQGAAWFLPSPGMDSFGYEHARTYRYLRVLRHGKPVGHETDPRAGIAFTSVVHAATLLAAYLGFTRFLYVGLDGGDATQHFYGKGYPNDYNRLGNEKILRAWDEGFAVLRRLLPDCTFLNLSTRTHITTLARDRWEKY